MQGQIGSQDGCRSEEKLSILSFDLRAGMWWIRDRLSTRKKDVQHVLNSGWQACSFGLSEGSGMPISGRIYAAEKGRGGSNLFPVEMRVRDNAVGFHS